MSIAIFSILVLYTPITNCQGNEGVRLVKAQTDLEQFGELYGQQFSKGLNNLEQITLSDEMASFKEDKWVGEFSLERGFMGVDLNMTYLKNETRIETLSPLPQGAALGWLVFYKYLIPKITIQYKFVQNIKFIGSITGRFDIDVNNVIAEVKIEVSLPNVGRCVYSDRAVKVMFKVSDYKVNFKINGGWYVGKTVSFVGEKIINTFIKGTLLGKAKKAINEKLNEVQVTSSKKAGKDFHKKMESLLCLIE